MPPPELIHHRRQLLQIYAAAIGAVHGRERVRAFLRGMAVHSPVSLVAIGKAACAMTQGAIDALGDRIHGGLVVTKHGYRDASLESCGNLKIVEAGHPLPDRCSLDAGASLVEFIHAAPADAVFLFLISGGASALVEVLPDGIDLAGLVRANQWLQASGLPISAVNQVRRQLSRIKGGRLATHLNGRRALQLLISDVPDDRVGDIGSGLLSPRASAPAAQPSTVLPPWLEAMLAHAALPVEADAPQFAAIETHVIANATMARHAAVATAQRLGYDVTACNEPVSGDAVEYGRRLARTIATSRPGLYVCSGETTVTLPHRPGRGGRNQHLALAVAIEIAGRPDLLFLAGATDGSDGPGHDAGAIVDGDTCRRGQQTGRSAPASLAAADAGSFLDAAGALIRTGPTGTNVMDLVIALRIAADA